MAGTAADKLLIKPDTTVWISSLERAALFEQLPAGTMLTAAPAEAMTVWPGRPTAAAGQAGPRCAP
jgi:hypothetical protein